MSKDQLINDFERFREVRENRYQIHTIIGAVFLHVKTKKYIFTLDWTMEDDRYMPCVFVFHTLDQANGCSPYTKNWMMIHPAAKNKKVKGNGVAYVE